MLPSFLVASRARSRRESSTTSTSTSSAVTTVTSSQRRSSSPRRRYRSRNCRELGRLEGRARARAMLRPQRRGGDHSGALENELRAIREQVERLERQRLLLQSVAVTARSNAVGRAVAQVRRFYELFAEGFNPDTRPEQSAVAERFLRATMVEDVVCSEFRGVDTFLRQYHMCTIGHQSMRLVFEQALVINESPDYAATGGWNDDDEVIQVRANAVARLRMSRETIKRFFPRIMGDEELAQKLIGKEYMFQYDKVFHFRGGRVFQHESKVDFVAGMLTMVQNPFVASKLLEASVMTKRGHLKVDCGVSEDLHLIEDAALEQ